MLPDKPLHRSMSGSGGVLGTIALLLWLWKDEIGMDAETVQRIVLSMGAIASCLIVLGFRKLGGKLLGAAEASPVKEVNAVMPEGMAEAIEILCESHGLNRDRIHGKGKK